jgi:hypothetical protein
LASLRGYRHGVLVRRALFHHSPKADLHSSYLLLQQVQVQHLESKQLDTSHPEVTKALIALHYARRMAWDMVRESIQKVKSEEDLQRLPFARLSFAMRATIAIFETKQYDGDIDYTDAELQGFTKVLQWFAARWSVGGEWRTTHQD